MSTHYSNSMSPKLMHSSMVTAIEELLPLLKQLDAVPVFVFTGFSGISNATVLSHLLSIKHDIPHYMVYVRKENERSHGSPIEHNYFDMETVRPNAKRLIIFVDDHIDSGKTRERCITEFLKLVIDSTYRFHNMKFHDNVYQLTEKVIYNPLPQLRVWLSLEDVYKNYIKEE